VIDERDGEVVYTLRIAGTSFRPKVFREGTYPVRVDEGDEARTLRGLEVRAGRDERTRAVDLDARLKFRAPFPRFPLSRRDRARLDVTK
jgi:hypothetical protein